MQYGATINCCDNWGKAINEMSKDGRGVEDSGR